MKVVAVTLLGVGFEVNVYKSYRETWMLSWRLELVAFQFQGNFGHTKTPYYARLDSDWWRGAIGRGFYVWQKGNGGRPPCYTTVREKGAWTL